LLHKGTKKASYFPPIDLIVDDFSNQFITEEEELTLRDTEPAFAKKSIKF